MKAMIRMNARERQQANKEIRQNAAQDYEYYTDGDGTVRRI